MSNPRELKDLDVAARERLDEHTLALAEDVFALGDPRLDAVIRDLMQSIGRVIAWNLDEPSSGGQLQ